MHFRLHFTWIQSLIAGGGGGDVILHGPASEELDASGARRGGLPDCVAVRLLTLQVR